MTEVFDPFWFDQPSILWRQDRFVEFYISCDMNLAEKLNAITRFFIYVSIILSFYLNNFKYLSIIIIVLIITYFIYTNYSKH